MFAFRLVLVLMVLAIFVCVGLYFYTKEPRYLRYTARIVQYTAFWALLLGLVFFVERYLLTSMGMVL